MQASARSVDHETEAPCSTEMLADLETALALSRATTRAMFSLSQLSHREMVNALRQEIAIYETLPGDAVSETVAAVLRHHLHEGS